MGGALGRLGEASGKPRFTGLAAEAQSGWPQPPKLTKPPASQAPYPDQQELVHGLVPLKQDHGCLQSPTQERTSGAGALRCGGG